MDQFCDDFWKLEPPTPSEIRERCIAIQSTWSESERLRRARLDAHTLAVSDDDRERGQLAELNAKAALRKRGMR